MLKKKEVIKQIEWLYCNIQSYKLIKEINYPNINSTFVGQVCERLNPNNYDFYYQQMYFDSKYSIMLDDDSLIFFEYRFDNSDNLIQHSLSYLPTPFQFTNEDNGEEIDHVQCAYLNKYLRIDFDSIGYKEFTHTYVHMHIGLLNCSTRFPVSHIISPLEFVSLIFTHFYGQPISFPIKAQLNLQHIIRLNPKENEHFKFSFGNSI